MSPQYKLFAKKSNKKDIADSLILGLVKGKFKEDKKCSIAIGKYIEIYMGKENDTRREIQTNLP